MDFFDQNFDKLVFYALEGYNDEPVPKTPSLVLPVAKEVANRLFSPDSAPYLTLLDRDQFFEELARVQAKKSLGPEERAVVDSVRQWFQGLPAKACAYQMEPSAIAGDGTARMEGLKA